MDDGLTLDAQIAILTRIVTTEGPIVLHSEPMNYQQIVLAQGVLCIDYFSPRENLTYSCDPIPPADAWAHAQAVCPEVLARYTAEYVAEHRR